MPLCQMKIGIVEFACGEVRFCAKVVCVAVPTRKTL